MSLLICRTLRGRTRRPRRRLFGGSAPPAPPPKLDGYAPPPVSPLRAAMGVEGYGADTPAGRGGQMIVVTTTAATGPGSLSEALNTLGARRIVFAVGGKFTGPPGDSRGCFTIAHGNVTVYGQTAPGDGVEMLGNPGDGRQTMVVQSSDVCFQYVRFSRTAGPAGAGPFNGKWGAGDSIGIGSFPPDAPIGRVVFDHCTIRWGTDETLDIFNRTHDVTISSCLVYECLEVSTDAYFSGRSGRSTYANDRSNRISIVRSVIANGTTRMPMWQDATEIDVRSNLIFHYESGAEVQPRYNRDSTGNIVGNLFINGQAARFEVSLFQNPDGGTGESIVHVAGNGRIERGDDTIQPIRMKGLSGPLAATHRTVTAPEIPSPRPALIALEDLEDTLLPDVGCSISRDASDERVIAQIRARVGSVVDLVDGAVTTSANQSSVGTARDVASPTIASGVSLLGPAPDFVPLAWKRANGLADEVDASVTDSNNDGYLDVEDWIDSLRTREVA